MKILIVITGAFTTDGISNSLMNYLKYIPKDNLQIDYVCSKISNPKEKWLELIKSLNFNLYEIPNRKKRPIHYIKNLRKLIRTNKYDIVHANGNSATLFLEMYAAYKENINIRIAHSHNTQCQYKIIDKILRPIFYHYCNVRFACGYDAGKWLFKDRDFTIIKNGDDCEKFKYKEVPSTLLPNDFNNKFCIISIGAVNAQKNYEFALKIMNKLKLNKFEFVYLILGKDNKELKQTLLEYINSHNLNDNVQFLGIVNNPEDFLSMADILIMPSIYEGLPSSLIEERH